MTKLTDTEIAQTVLKSHAIQPHWKRTGEQMISLLEEAAKMARENI